MPSIESALQSCLQPDADPIESLALLVSAVRPKPLKDIEQARNSLESLCFQLDQYPSYRVPVRNALLSLLTDTSQVSLYVEAGLVADTGFFSELSRRISNRLFPALIQRDHLRDAISLIFSNKDDHLWVNGVGEDCWERLFIALHLHEVDPTPAIRHTCAEWLDAVQILSYRIAAAGLDQELLRNEPTIEKFESPFLTQNVEARAFLEAYQAWLLDTGPATHDGKHILVLLDQCEQLVQKIRRNAMQRGTSIALTYKLWHLSQHIDRMEKLLVVLHDWSNVESRENGTHVFALASELLRGENQKNHVSNHLRDSLGMIALRMTENAGRTGEHYITETRSEYFGMLRSAMLGGVIVAFMAAMKLVLAKLHLAPLTEAFAFSLNYALGFVLIHILHGTVATKQPAMTAAALAASIGETPGKKRDLSQLVNLIARTVRSQLIAILGNVCMVVPVAIGIAMLVHMVSGDHFLTPQKSLELMDSINPLGPTLFYAAIAGVCLFLSGLIAGYYDNMAIYNHIPQRLRQLPSLQRLLGKVRLERFAVYVENNLGALAGNFYFGLLLGSMTAIGVLFGLPIDIRHITFSAAYLGFSLTALDFAVYWQSVLLPAAGVMLIGLTNLAVSFTLALIVALRARQVSFAQERQLVINLLQHLRSHTRDFFLPPRKADEQAVEPEKNDPET
ncbi:MAG: site-specific recombinase [Pseudomonadota bacterium]